MDVIRRGVGGLIALCCCWCWCVRGEGPERSARWLEGPAGGSGVFRFRVHFLNGGASTLRVAIPPTLEWQWVNSAGGSPETGQATRLSTGPGERSVDPGQFVSEDYQGEIRSRGWTAGTLVVPDISATGWTLVGEPPPREPMPPRPGEPAPTTALPVVAMEAPYRPSLDDSATLDFFRRHFRGHEPLYFIWGPERPNVKFQISLRYRLLDPDAELRPAWEWSHGLNLAYTQVSLWDWDTPSAPFFDSSYKPELMWTLDDFRPSWLDRVDTARRWSGRVGMLHESNGQAGAESRALNMFYFRPSYTFGNPTNLFLEVAPRAWTYLGTLRENPDLPDYRGYADLSLRMGWAEGMQMAGFFRVGDSLDRGSMQLDLSYPTLRLFGDLDLFLHLQYFNGWGESLLEYDERTWSVRVGISLYR